MMPAAPVRTDIVLLGGGHAHVHVLTAFAKLPEPGVRITLIARELETPYSGMLPGVIAGLYTAEQAHIDLVRLAAATGTRLIHAEATGIDRISKRIELSGRPPLAYDIVSVDVGITPALVAIEGAAEHAIAVKPIGSFLGKFDELLARCRRPDGPRKIVVIGGGAGGVELLLSVRSRLRSEVSRHAQDFSFTLVTADNILTQHNARVRAAFRRVFAERGIALHDRKAVRAVSAQGVTLADGAPIAADAVLVTTDAAPPTWFAATGLARDDGGFLAIGRTLQVLNDPDVFAVGDCAGLTEDPRPKAGVFAVRAGPFLADNLRRRARGDALQPWYPQRSYLALISTGERYAVASRGAFKAEGAWLWTVKDWIDRRWMRMYQDTDRMIASMAAKPPPAAPRETPEMRCGGCAAKVGPGPLSRALARLSPVRAEGVLVGLDAPDDAAVIAPTAGKHLVQTVDFFRAFIDDPYTFGEIAANHALNDVFAMGGVPRHALATAMVPPGPSARVEETLFQLLAGARACLDREAVALVGGHSGEGELALGFSVTGEVAPDGIVRKGGLKAGDALILTRPIGTGILFAAAMRGRAKARWIEATLAGMRQSNREAAHILISHGASAMTDVTGFGLIGHLGEMLAASGISAELDLAGVPLGGGALALAREGIASTLLPENLALGALLCGEIDAATRAILFDPQTSGPLLAGVPAASAAACVAALRQNGYAEAAVVGRTSGAASARELVIAARGQLAG
jgi:selenide,water dikinase